MEELHPRPEQQFWGGNNSNAYKLNEYWNELHQELTQTVTVQQIS